jgi:hypothetical protein
MPSFFFNKLIGSSRQRLSSPSIYTQPTAAEENISKERRKKKNSPDGSARALRNSGTDKEQRERERIFLYFASFSIFPF